MTKHEHDNFIQNFQKWWFEIIAADFWYLFEYRICFKHTNYLFEFLCIIISVFNQLSATTTRIFYISSSLVSYIEYLLAKIGHLIVSGVFKWISFNISTPAVTIY